MASSIQYPMLNGVRHSWASLEVKFNQTIVFITSLNYTRKRTRTMLRVNHPDPVGKTRGSNEYTADVEMLLAEFNVWQGVLIGLAYQQGLSGGYGDVLFNVTVNYTENGLDTVTDQLIGCTMDSTEASNAEGTEGTKRKFELNPLKVYLGGNQDDLPTPLVAPPGG